MESQSNNGAHWYMFEKTWTRSGPELLPSSMKQKYAKKKLAVAAIISFEQKKVSAWYLEKPLKIRSRFY